MLKGIEKYLKVYMEDFMFIEIGQQVTESKKDISFLKDVPIPISVERVAHQIQKEGFERVPFDAMVKGMIYTLGVDKEFKYNEAYKKFLYLAHPEIVNYILYQGVQLAEEEKYVDAIIHFRAVLVLEENNLNAMVNYGKCCSDIHDTSKDLEEKKTFKQEALNTFESILDSHPDYPVAYYYLGYLSVNQKTYQKAKIYWKKFLELSDDEDKKEEIMVKLAQIEDYVIYERGYTHILNSEFAKGLELLLQLEERHKEWWNLLFFIGLAYRNLKRMEEAIEYFKRVLILKPSQRDTINELGLCYTSIFDLKAAEKYFKKALILGEDHEVLCNLAVVYMNTGEFKKAEEALEEALALCPDDPIVLQWMEKLDEITGTIASTPKINKD
ncbi:MAG: tetratricopeptide repeat protein [Peptostreptococcales bacterium]